QGGSGTQRPGALRRERQGRQHHFLRGARGLQRLPGRGCELESGGVLSDDRGDGRGGRVTDTYRLILLRHGESEWNALDLFTGWVDVGLSPKGEAEAVHAGQLLRDRGLLPDVVHTSVLKRAIRTADLTLDACNRQWVPVRRSWRLNERHYGALQGRGKRDTLQRYGEEQFLLWRRSYSTAP